MEIPKNIHLIYSEKQLPIIYERFYKSILQFHPHWKIEIYDDKSSRELVKEKFPQLLYVYDNYKYNIQRADLFRILAVYIYGGFYMDLDILCLKNIDDLCKYNMVLGEEVFLNEEDNTYHNHLNRSRVANYMFGSISGHPFWLDVIDKMIINANKPIKNEEDILNTTGPALLTDVYHDVKSNYDDILMLFNRELKCQKNCEKISCHFGEYAAHYHLGTWRFV